MLLGGMGMAYRISYERGRKTSLLRETEAMKVQALAAGLLFLFLMAAKLTVPGAGEVLVGLFQPDGQGAVQAMAREFCESGSLWESMVAFCRQVLEASGYGA